MTILVGEGKIIYESTNLPTYFGNGGGFNLLPSCHKEMKQQQQQRKITENNIHGKQTGKQISLSLLFRQGFDFRLNGGRPCRACV